MPRYYFDIQDGEQFSRDEQGMELDGLEAAKREAAAALPDIAREVIPDSGRRDVVVGVRDSHGTYVVRAVLVLAVETT